MMVSTQSMPGVLFPTKYIGETELGHTFIPKHEDGEFKNLFESYNAINPINLKSLDQLDNYIITEENGEWFEENINPQKNHFTIKSGRKADLIVPVDSVIMTKDYDDLENINQFDRLLDLPNESLNPIHVVPLPLIEGEEQNYIVYDGNHRLLYSELRGYTHIPVTIEKSS
jgi:hypothetical protein